MAKIKWHFFERKNLKMITSLSAEILDNYLSTCSRKCGIDALPPKHEVKMAGYWTSSFFAFLRTETEKRSIKTQKKKSSHLDRTSLVNKGFIVWQKAFALILRESRMTYPISSDSFDGTINSQNSFMPFFSFWLSSETSKLPLLKPPNLLVHPTRFFFSCAVSKRESAR